MSEEAELVVQGYLHAGETEDYSIVLEAETSYSFELVSDDETVDFDLLLLDEGFNVIDMDTDDSADAVCTVTPAWTGKFYLRVKCQRGSSGFSIYLS